ncbi:hypothetical protein SAMN05421538_103306 [Paracoccus isoporae]|uniref:Transmembrane transcriptional regulator (Anti-sigma factor RsiW) n=1 Tax=Paracoccus isoporae TaxID=591205 RepID=A0A1G6ZNA2_9RHOB|nr:hypothetical protein [Paracoccus isoporae]SDE03687.1 hypothetical protein SAMN05421538_103306 [Paracoccus isoporae]
MQLDDETLMALADGELEPARAAAVRQTVASDPDLQQRLHRFEETRRRLGELRTAPETEDPLAARIRAAAAQTGPASAPVAVAAPANLNRRPRLAAAAAAVLAVGIGWWWLDDPRSEFSGPEIAALDGLPSGETQRLGDSGDLVMIASFLTVDGGFCREYEVVGSDAVRVVLACETEDGWLKRFAATTETGDDSYRPASGTGAIDDALEEIGAAGVMTPEEEARKLAR